MGEFIILVAFILLVAVLLPYLFHKYPALFYATDSHIIYAKDLVQFIFNCTWIKMNNIHYDTDRLHIVKIDETNHNYCEIKSLGNTTFEVEIDKDEISLIHTLENVNTDFEHYFDSLNGKWDFSDNPSFMYIQDLHQQMLYAEALCHRFNV